MRTKIIIPIITFLILIGFTLACSDSTKNEETEKEEYPVEYQLAVINAGGFVEEDSVTVAEFRQLLDSLLAKTKNTEIDIADTLVMTQKILREDHNIELSLLKITRDLDNSIPDEVTDIDLEDVAVLYIILIIGE